MKEVYFYYRSSTSQASENVETAALAGGSARGTLQSEDTYWAYADFNLKMDLVVQFNPASGAALILGVDNIDICNGTPNQLQNRISDVSGYTAGSSNTGSSCSATYINPAKGLRLSDATIFSSSSNSTEARIQQPQKVLSRNRLAYLQEKYLNHELLYNILSYIDQIVTQVPHEDQQLNLSQPMQVKRSSKRLLQKNPKRRKLEEISEAITIDKIVFAKSSKNSNKYFPGKSFTITESGDYMVDFYNGESKRVAKQYVFEDFQESPTDMKVMFLKPNKYGRKTAIPALVLDIKVDDDEVLCNIMTDEGDVDDVHISYLYLTDSIINEFNLARKKSPIELQKDKPCYIETSDKLDSATHRETTNFTELELTTELGVPSSSGQKPTVHIGLEPVTDNESETDRVFSATAVEMSQPQRRYVPYLSSASSDDSDPPEEVVDGCHPEKVFYLPVLNVNVKSKSRTPTIKNSKFLGPLHRGNWFKDLAFILTCSRYCESVEEQETIATDDENYVFSEVPFVHTHLVAQIRLGGGCVFDNYADVPAEFRKKLLLVAPRPCLTARYVQCISYDIKVVSHEWIINCCKSKSILPYQELPLGWSIEMKRFLNNFERHSTEPFKNLAVRITSRTRNNTFFEFWSSIMRAGGAIVRPTRRIKFAKDLIIIDSGYHFTQLPVAVTPIWVIQSILHGEMRDISAERLYQPADF